MTTERTADARARSPLAGEPGADRARRLAGLAVAVVERVAVDETEDIGALVVRAHDQAPARGEGAPQRLVLVAGRVRAFQVSGERVALLLRDDERREPAAAPFVLGDAVALAGPGPDQRRLGGERRRCQRRRDDQRGDQSFHLEASALLI